MIFAENLKKFIDANHLSQIDFCRNTGFKPSTVSNWIKGKSEPPKGTKKYLAEILNLPDDYFGQLLPDPTKLRDDPQLTPKEAAELLKKDVGFVKASLEQHMCPFGWAIKMKQWTYCIIEPAFRAFTKIKDDSNINVPVPLAAKLIGMSDNFLYESLKQKACPFGWAALGDKGKWSYCIPIGAFEAHTHINITRDEMKEMIT